VKMKQHILVIVGLLISYASGFGFDDVMVDTTTPDHFPQFTIDLDKEPEERFAEVA